MLDIKEVRYLNITQDFITQFAINSSSLTNGKDLVRKDKYEDLKVNEDKDILFGVCKVNKKKSYNCYLDLKNKLSPIVKCDCNSGQMPCKHIIGLLFCYKNGKTFTEGELVEEQFLQYRDPIKKKTENTIYKSKKITKAQITSAIKKCESQLEGIQLSEKMLKNIVLSGINGIDNKSIDFYKEQIKELGNYYVSGIQQSFLEFFYLCSKRESEQNLLSCVYKINYINALLRKAKDYIKLKISDYKCYPEIKENFKEAMTKSLIEEQIGHIWRKPELIELSLYKKNIELVQVLCNRYRDEINNKYIYEQIWLSISTGEIYKTYKSEAITIREIVKKEDTIFSVVEVDELYTYPEELNPRIKWEECRYRQLESNDLKRLKEFSNEDFALIIKKVKSQIKNPLSNQNPIYSLNVSDIRKDDKGNLAIFDNKGFGIPLRLKKFGKMLNKVSETEVKNQVLICSFSYDIEKNTLYGTPISLINSNKIIRFYY